MGARRSGVRWREEGWEIRCDDCAKTGHLTSYWPLTDEFWDRHNMARCRACHLARRRRKDHETYWKNEVRRAQKAEDSRLYRVEAAEAIRIKRRTEDHRARDRRGSSLRYWADPDAKRAKARAYYRRNRDEIVAKRRERYHKDKAA